MQGFPNNKSKIDEKIVKERGLIAVSSPSPSANRELTNAAPAAPPIDRVSDWKQSLQQSIALQATFIPRPGTLASPPIVAVTAPNRSLIALSTGSYRNREAATAPDRLEQAKTALKEAKIALALSQADLTQAELNLQTFKTDYERDRDLHRSGAIDRQKLARTNKIYNFAKMRKGDALYGL